MTPSRRDSRKMAPAVAGNRIQRRRGVSLKWKIPLAFSAVVILVSLTILGAAGHFLAGSLREQLDKRVSSIAVNLSDASTGYLVSKDALRLHALVAKYGLIDGVAYVSIADAGGKPVARNLETSLPEPGVSEASRGPESITVREVLFRGTRVMEARAPILEGRAGYALVGMGAEELEGEVYDALTRLVGLAGFVLLGGLVMSFWVARRMVRPIVQLTHMAEKMSKGDLDSAIVIRARGELGELAIALERMRASLKAAISRLSRQPFAGSQTRQGGENHERATV